MQTVLTIPAAQSDYLASLQAQAESALAAFRAAFSTVIRGHDLTDAKLVGLDGTQLTVEVPDAPTG